MFSEGEARGGFGEAICCCEARLDRVVGGEAVEAMELRSGAMFARVASCFLLSQNYAQPKDPLALSGKYNSTSACFPRCSLKAEYHPSNKE